MSDHTTVAPIPEQVEYRCAKCARVLPLSGFQLKASGRPKFPCKACRAADNRAYRESARNRERLNARRRAAYQPRPRPKTSPADRFWAKVVRGEGCWEWSGSLNEHGYGEFNRGVSKAADCVLAHRFSYEISRGPIPDGLCVLHECDNPRCVRPGHLFLGTKADNSADMVAKGRQRSLKGEDAPRARLTEAQVREARSKHRQGDSCSALARRYRVGNTTMRHVLQNKSWKHLTEEKPREQE